MNERLPDFLIIGAMKAGTTTLYQDLRRQSQIAFSISKEPHCLREDHVLTDAGRREYAAYFATARDDQVCGEASTGYTKIPQYMGVPERARAVLKSDLKLIYVVRNPVDRAVSHHHHLVGSGRCPPSIEDAVRADSTLIDFGRYTMQAEAWLKHYPRENLLILVFEEYVRDRRQAVMQICNFLGVEADPERVDPEKRYNTAEQRRSLPAFAIISRTGFYKRVVRRWTPQSLRQAIARAVLPPAPGRPPPPSEETVEHILEATRDDHRRLQELMGRSEAIWDEEATRQRYRRLREQHATPAQPHSSQTSPL